MREWITVALLTFGVFFMLLSAVGLLRMPDLFTRLQATSKASTMGIGYVLLAVIVYFGGLGVAARAMLILAFIMLTNPLAAHMIGRAAYVSGEPLEESAVRDELRGRSISDEPLSDESLEHTGRDADDHESRSNSTGGLG